MKIALATLDDALHQYAKNFAAAVERDSGGRIKTEIYPASQLGSIERQAFRRSSVHRGHTTQPFDRHHRCDPLNMISSPVPIHTLAITSAQSSSIAISSPVRICIPNWL